MGGGDPQRTVPGVGEFAGRTGDVFHFEQDAPGRLQNPLARRGDAVEMLAVAFENEHAQFVFEQADLFADAGLRGVQGGRGGGDVERPLGHFVDIDQLAEFHGNDKVRFYSYIILNYKNIFLSGFKPRWYCALLFSGSRGCLPLASPVCALVWRSV
jgi:hypothetical protein